MSFPDAMNGRMADTPGVSESAGAPLRRLGGKSLQGRIHDAGDLIGVDPLPSSRAWGVLEQSHYAQMLETSPPVQNRWPAGAEFFGDVMIRKAVGCQQYDRTSQS